MFSRDVEDRYAQESVADDGKLAQRPCETVIHGSNGQGCLEGVAYRAEQELGWNRLTISKGLHELASGIECIDGRKGLTGRKPAEAHLPNLLSDIRDLLDSQSHTDARFRTHRLYTRMSVAEVRRQLQAKKGYRDEELPSEETLRCKVNRLGYYPTRVQKTQVKKRSQKPTPSSRRSAVHASKPAARTTSY